MLAATQIASGAATQRVPEHLTTIATNRSIGRLRIASQLVSEAVGTEPVEELR
jgi:hypothetical protein